MLKVNKFSAYEKYENFILNYDYVHRSLAIGLVIYCWYKKVICIFKIGGEEASS